MKQQSTLFTEVFTIQLTFAAANNFNIGAPIYRYSQLHIRLLVGVTTPEGRRFSDFRLFAVRTRLLVETRPKETGLLLSGIRPGFQNLRELTISNCF